MKRFITLPFLLILAFFAGRLLMPWPPTHAAPSPAYQWVNIAGSTSATSVIDGPAVLHTMTVNTAGASSVITLFNLSAANCTGTPSTNKIGTYTLPASGVLPGSLLYDLNVSNGICVQDGTAASDKTIVYSK
jgi:hypothetical protein